MRRRPCLIAGGARQRLEGDLHGEGRRRCPGSCPLPAPRRRRRAGLRRALQRDFADAVDQAQALERQRDLLLAGRAAAEREGGHAAGRRRGGDAGASRRRGGRRARRGAAPDAAASRQPRLAVEPTVPSSEVIEASLGQHAAELVEGVSPVEAGVDELGDGLRALLAQRREARVRRELRGLRPARCCARAVSDAASALRLETWWWAMP